MFKTLWKALPVAAAVIFATFTGSAEAAGQATQPNICDRSCWGSRSTSTPSTMSALNRAIIHHTAGPGDYNVSNINDSKAKVRAIQNYHMDVNGWSDVGYHFLFDKLGNSFEGRRNSINKSQRPRGAHDGVNTNSFGFSALGYYHPPYNHAFTQAQQNAMWDVIAWRMPDGYSPYGDGSYGGNTVGYLDGHRDARATACPGDIIYNSVIGTNHNAGIARDEVWARIQGSGGGPGGDETIIDNSDPEFSTTGSWGASNGAGFYGTNSLWASNGGTTTDIATWAPGLDRGSYDVYAWWVASSNRSTDAVYVVETIDGPSGVQVNQTANGGQWNYLGVFNMDSNGVVTIEDNASGAVISADAIRFVRRGPVEIIIDNNDSGFSTVGSWGTSNGSGFYGTNSLWAGTGSGASATWDGNLSNASYEVFAWWVASSNRSPDAVYQINHLGGTSNIPANQTINGGQWNSLGTYSFDANGDVTLTDSGTGAVVSADAIRFVEAGPAEIIVDNMDPGFSASGNWFQSTTVPGYYASNYHARLAQAISDSASWSADLSNTGDYEVFARWTTGTNRATSAPYIVTHAGGNTTVTVNQTQNNGVWVSLGTYTFNSGNSTRVMLSCWTSSGQYVIADAIRLVPQ